MRILPILLLTTSLYAQKHTSHTPTPRVAKKGEERAQFMDKNGKACGQAAQIDNRWYFYLEPDKNSDGKVSQAFDTRKEAVAWGMLTCPKPGTSVVAK